MRESYQSVVDRYRFIGCSDVRRSISTLLGLFRFFKMGFVEILADLSGVEDDGEMVGIR